MMLMPASAEFAALCQSQLLMMAETVGADSTAVYLAESWSDQMEPKLLPIAVYPDEFSPSPRSLLPDRMLPEGATVSQEVLDTRDRSPSIEADYLQPRGVTSSPNQTTSDSPPPSQRLAIPLLHEGGVLGVLVGWRADRPWNDGERHQMEEYARSLTLACVLDQRGQWLKSQLSSLDQVQTQQSDRFHELLHQLRSPLTALKTFGRLLKKRLPLEDQNQTLVSNMLRESDRMHELLGYFDDTLQAADDSREETATTVPLLAPAAEVPTGLEPLETKSTSGSLAHFGGDLKIQAYDVAVLVEPVIDLTQSLAEDANMAFHALSPTEATLVQTDAKAFMEILSNFLDNSLKYANSGSHLWIQWGLTRSDRAPLTGILVGDTGPGIPEDDQAHIFERHFRGLQASGELEGSGLGLAIAADLVDEMRGIIEIFSPLSRLPWPLPDFAAFSSKDRGTAFVIWLPRAEGSDIDFG